MTEMKDAEELRKRVTALLLAGSPLGLFDNASKTIDSGVLSALLTATVWKDRLLGVSRMVRLPIRTTWMVTGNELEFSRETLRRTVWIRMDAKSPEPHLRTRFRHDPLREWVHAHRGEILGALCVLVQHWIAEGQARFTTRRLGSYEGWGEVIGGILVSAGINGFLENLETFSARSER